MTSANIAWSSSSHVLHQYEGKYLIIVLIQEHGHGGSMPRQKVLQVRHPTMTYLAVGSPAVPLQARV